MRYLGSPILRPRSGSYKRIAALRTDLQRVSPETTSSRSELKRPLEHANRNVQEGAQFMRSLNRDSAPEFNAETARPEGQGFEFDGNCFAAMNASRVGRNPETLITFECQRFGSMPTCIHGHHIP